MRMLAKAVSSVLRAVRAAFKPRKPHKPPIRPPILKTPFYY